MSMNYGRKGAVFCIFLLLLSCLVIHSIQTTGTPTDREYFVITTEDDWKQGSFEHTMTNGFGSLHLEDLIYGDGHDDDLTISSGSYTIDQDMYYSNLTVLEGATLDTQGHAVYVSCVLANYGIITDNLSGGEGGEGGDGGQGGQGDEQVPPLPGEEGDPGNPPSYTAPGFVGYGGHGSGGAGGGGFTYDTITHHYANGGDGGKGGTGGKGGGYVRIYAHELRNHHHIHADGFKGEKGLEGQDGGYDEPYFYGGAWRDDAGGAGGGGQSGDGGNGGIVEIYAATIDNSGQIHAFGGGYGEVGDAGHSYCCILGHPAQPSQTFIFGEPGADGGGQGGDGEIEDGCYGMMAQPGEPGNIGEMGLFYPPSIYQSIYLTEGTYYSNVFTTDEPVYWEEALVDATIPAETSVELQYGTYEDSEWQYYDSIEEVNPSSQIKLKLVLTTTDEDNTPEIHEIILNYSPDQPGFILDLEDFPMYEAETPYHEMCGPAVAQMTLNYIWWDSIQYPDEIPMVFDDQQWLYETGHANNSDPSIPHLDTVGLWKLLQTYRPLPYSEYGYNFNKYQRDDDLSAIAMLCEWVNYTIGTYGGYTPGHPLQVPAIVPAYGDYSNWMAVRGIHTDQPCYPLPDDLTVYGFWVNDPYPMSLGGIGANSYKTTTDWLDSYYWPLSTEDTYHDKYMAICEPPEIQQHISVNLASSPQQFSHHQQHLLNFVQMNQQVATAEQRSQVDQWVIQAAIQGVTDYLIPFDDDFAQVFSGTIPSQPLFIRDKTGDDYYAVSFNVPRKLSQQRTPFLCTTQSDKQTRCVILIDALDGHFKEASWVHQPVKYLPVTREDVYTVLSQFLLNHGISITESTVIRIELMHNHGSPYYPEWNITLPQHSLSFSITQQGETQPDLSLYLN